MPSRRSVRADSKMVLSPHIVVVVVAVVVVVVVVVELSLIVSDLLMSGSRVVKDDDVGA